MNNETVEFRVGESSLINLAKAFKRGTHLSNARVARDLREQLNVPVSRSAAEDAINELGITGYLRLARWGKYLEMCSKPRQDRAKKFIDRFERPVEGLLRNFN